MRIKIGRKASQEKRRQLLFFATHLRAFLRPEINLRMVDWAMGGCGCLDEAQPGCAGAFNAMAVRLQHQFNWVAIFSLVLSNIAGRYTKKICQSAPPEPTSSQVPLTHPLENRGIE